VEERERREIEKERLGCTGKCAGTILEPANHLYHLWGHARAPTPARTRKGLNLKFAQGNSSQSKETPPTTPTALASSLASKKESDPGSKPDRHGFTTAHC
jgi:hypothetical protein